MDDEIKAGDAVVCIKEVHFIYGQMHSYGQILFVTPDTAAYYNVIKGAYLKIEITLSANLTCSLELPEA